MKKLTKKTLLTFGTIATIAAPVAAVVSCGSDATGSTGADGAKAYLDQANDGKIKIMTGFSKGGVQERALQAQIDQYNKTMKPKDKVEIARIEGGYNAESSTLTTKLEAKDTKTLPNLIIGYGDTLGTIGKYDMQLNLEEGSSKDLRNKFEAKFVSENDNIGGIDGSKGTYMVPLAKSTEVNNINKEVIGYILKQIKAAGGTVAGTNVTAIMGDVNAGDEAKVAALWGTADTTKAAKMKVDDSIFTTYSGMINFAAQAQDLFKNAETNKDLHILGIDAPANLVYEMVYAELGNKDLKDPHSFMFAKGDDGYLSHPWREDHSSVEAKALKTVYDSLKAGLENGGLMINGGGAYSSQTEVYHKVGMAIGSTAGYSHNFVKGSSATFTYEATTTKDGKPTTAKVTMDHTDQYKEVNGKFVFSSFNNQILLAPDEISTNDHDIKITDATKIAAIKALRAHALADPSVVLAVSSNGNAKDVKDAIQLTTGTYPKYLIASDADPKLTVKVVTQDDTLQEDELLLLQAPTTKDGNGSKSIFSQGPSLIGLHANEEEDEGTRLFVKWLASTTTPGTSLDERDPNHDKLAAVPMTQFNFEAGYIGVLKGAFDGAVNAGFNPAQKIAYQGFKDAVKTPDYRIFTNPIDDTTSAIRNAFDDTMRQEYDLRATASGPKSHVVDMEAIYGLLKA